MMSPEKHQFFESMGHLGLTYDDVRTVPGPEDPPAPDVHWSEFFNLPYEPVDVTSRFSRNVNLKIPIATAAMDTVTGAEMGIAIAKLGGIGVIHYAMSVEEQKNAATRVKLHLNGVIDKPVNFRPEQTVEAVLEERDRRGLGFSTFLVADGENHLVGLLTDRRFRFARNDLQQHVREIMIPEEDVVSAPAGISADEAYQHMAEHDVSMLPLVHEDGTIAGLYLLSDVERELDESRYDFNLDRDGRLVTAIAVPTSLSARERIEACRKYIDVVVLDTARGDGSPAIKAFEMIRELFPDLDIVAGNVSNGKSARLWAERGADAIKVGQGGGSICTTRIETGIGIPQVTAIYQCARETEQFDIPIIADGGVSKNGDLTVAIAAGAHSVMVGNMVAGTEEAPGRTEIIKGQRVKEYRGMGSEEAMADNPELRQRYSADPSRKPLAEGVPGNVPYKGPVSRVVEEMVAGLRKGMEYSGKRDLQQQRDETMLVMGTGNALAEAKPHDLL